LEYFTDIWNIILPFGTFCVHLVHFSGFGIMYEEKSGNTGYNAGAFKNTGSSFNSEFENKYIFL
jgi:hypothetical protein